jgi:hypothetical protein
MKNLIITLSVFLLASFILKADPTKKDTTYKPTPELNKFNGTWQYKDSAISFTIVLKTQKIYFKKNNLFVDYIEGHHLFVKSNKTVQNSIGNQRTIRMGNYDNVDKKTLSGNIIRFFMVDLEREDREEGELALLQGNKLKFSVKNLGHSAMQDEKTRDMNIHIPTDIVLTKIE